MCVTKRNYVRQQRSARIISHNFLFRPFLILTLAAITFIIHIIAMCICPVTILIFKLVMFQKQGKLGIDSIIQFQVDIFAGISLCGNVRYFYICMGAIRIMAINKAVGR